MLATRLADASAATDDAVLSALTRTLSAALTAQAISAVHLGRADRIPEYGVFRSRDAPDDGVLHVVAILEATMAAGARAALAELRRPVDALDPAAEVGRADCSELLIAVARREVVPQGRRGTGRPGSPAPPAGDGEAP